MGSGDITKNKLAGHAKTDFWLASNLAGHTKTDLVAGALSSILIMTNDFEQIRRQYYNGPERIGHETFQNRSRGLLESVAGAAGIVKINFNISKDQRHLPKSMSILARTNDICQNECQD